MGGRGRSENGRKGFKDKPNTHALDTVNTFPELNPTPKMKITKVAEQAFDKTYLEARKLTKQWSEHEALGMSVQPNFGNRGYVSIQTLRGIQAKLNSEYRILETDKNLGISDYEELRKRKIALNMVQRGLNYSYNKHKKYWNIGKKKK